MDYATQHYFGDNSIARTKETGKTPSADGRIRQLDATNQRRRRNQKRQKAIRTAQPLTHGFLNCTFLPKGEQDEQPLNKTLERDFYRSLSSLCRHYNLVPLETERYGFPYNIALAYWDAVRKIRAKGSRDFNGLRLMENDKGTVFLQTDETYSTGTVLYYIPIVPLFEMLRKKKRKASAHLLLSVCAYLYHIADIPYYRQEDAYIYWQYEMLSDWVEQDDEEENFLCRKWLKDAEWIGDCMEQKLFNRKNLEVFENRIKAFIPKDDFDKDCLSLAKEAWLLYQKYPEASVFRHAQIPYEDPDKDDERVTMDKYISFVADTEGWLYDSLAECINNEFNEYGEMEEPSISKRFDGCVLPQGNLDFENSLFPLMENLCYLLNHA